MLKLTIDGEDWGDVKSVVIQWESGEAHFTNGKTQSNAQSTNVDTPSFEEMMLNGTECGIIQLMRGKKPDPNNTVVTVFPDFVGEEMGIDAGTANVTMGKLCKKKLLKRGISGNSKHYYYWLSERGLYTPIAVNEDSLAQCAFRGPFDDTLLRP